MKYNKLFIALYAITSITGDTFSISDKVNESLTSCRTVYRWLNPEEVEVLNGDILFPSSIS